MRRTLLLILTATVAVAVAAPAAAKPGKKPAPPPENPVPGVTCLEWAGSEAGSGALVMAVDAAIDPKFSVTLGAGELACVDVIAPAGDWAVSVEATGMRALNLIIRDSISPGDVCDIIPIKKPSDGDYVFTDVEASYVNACGTEWFELIDGVVYRERVPDFEHPLAFIVVAGNGIDARATIEVTRPSGG